MLAFIRVGAEKVTVVPPSVGPATFCQTRVTMLAASLALSDPHLSLAAVLKRGAGVNPYSLQSCADP